MINSYTTTLMQSKIPKILSNQRNAILIVFLIGITLRIIPEIVAYPNPIGYDVVNYYIPVTTNFDQFWPFIAGDFPLYASLLHIVNEITGLSAQSTVVIMAVLMFGIFSVAIFLTSRTLLKASVNSSIFMTIFVIFQIAILRTTWDLHRDILGLSAALLTFCLIVRSSSNNNNNNNNNCTYERLRKKITRYNLIQKEHDNSSKNNNNNNQKTSHNTEYNYSRIGTLIAIASIIATCTIAVGTARLVGFLFCVSIIINAIINRKSKRAIAYAAFTGTLFSILLFTSTGSRSSFDHQLGQIVNPPDDSSGVYNPRNLRMLFAVMDGILLIPGIYGFIKLEKARRKIEKESELRPNLNLLSIPLLLSLIGSFSWIAFPFNDLLLADRWIYLFGTFLSIFAAYGIVVGLIQGHLMKQRSVHNRDNNNNNIKSRNTIIPLLVSGGIIGMFVISGIAYAVMPYSDPFILFSKVRSHIEYFAPVTMQFSSMDVKDTSKLIGTIDWINKNIEPGAIIAGEKHWRGFMELNLRDDRTYVSVSYSDVLALAQNTKDTAAAAFTQGNQRVGYFIYHDISNPDRFVLRRVQTH